MPSGSFNDKFHPYILPLNHTHKKSWSAEELKANNFETERYGRIPLVNKYIPNWNNILKEIIKRKFLKWWRDQSLKLMLKTTF